MSYFRRPQRALSGGPPAWYRAMSGVSSMPPRRKLPQVQSLGSLGDAPSDPTTLSTPTVTDPTAAWQAEVLLNLQAGVKTLQMAEMQKWLQIAATLAIPLSAAVWKAIFRRGADITS